MERTIYMVRVVTHGLYEWGRGWVSSEKARLWNEFWSKCPSTFWFIAKPKDDISCPHLLSMAGGIYLHPMDFDAVLIGPEYLITDLYLSDLQETMKKCSEVVGFTYDFKVSKKQRITFNVED